MQHLTLKWGTLYRKRNDKRGIPVIHFSALWNDVCNDNTSYTCQHFITLSQHRIIRVRSCCITLLFLEAPSIGRPPVRLVGGVNTRVVEGLNRIFLLGPESDTLLTYALFYLDITMHECYSCSFQAYCAGLPHISLLIKGQGPSRKSLVHMLQHP